MTDSNARATLVERTEIILNAWKSKSFRSYRKKKFNKKLHPTLPDRGECSIRRVWIRPGTGCRKRRWTRNCSRSWRSNRLWAAQVSGRPSVGTNRRRGPRSRADTGSPAPTSCPAPRCGFRPDKLCTSASRPFRPRPYMFHPDTLIPSIKVKGRFSLPFSCISKEIALASWSSHRVLLSTFSDKCHSSFSTYRINILFVCDFLFN